MKNLYLLVFILIPSFAFSQWLPNPYNSGNISFTTGDVGIGTTAVTGVKLTVGGMTTLGTIRFYSDATGHTSNIFPGASYVGNNGYERGEDFYISGSGASTYGGNLKLLGGESNLGFGGNVYLEGGQGLFETDMANNPTFAVSKGGDVSIKGGSSTVYPGNVIINPGYGDGYGQQSPQYGNISIGTVGGGVTLGNNSGYVSISNCFTVTAGAVNIGTQGTGTTSVSIGNAGNVTMVSSTGKVGIGTYTPDSKLTVKGNIHAQEVRVDLLGAVAPDYVFEKNYKLPSLWEIEKYIQQNKHLPEVPSATEMERDGLNLKEMNLILLKKIEELTLHMIDQERQLTEQKSELVKLSTEVRTLKRNNQPKP